MAETLPATMRAVLLTRHGDFGALAHRDDVPVPSPRQGEVLVKVAAAGINNTDINTRIGWYANAVSGEEAAGWTGDAFAFPRIQGADACGRIVAVGDGVDASRLGERVLVEPVFRGGSRFDVVYFGSEVDGAFADYARVPAAHAHPIDSALSDIELASFPCAYSAAENMLTRAAVASGEHVLVTGASGGVGSAAVQLALRRGARVTAIASTDKVDAVRALGAEEVVPRRNDAPITLPANHFDVAIDCVGGPGFEVLPASLRRGGRYAVAGAISGANVALDLRTLYLKDLSLFGCTVLGPGVFADLVGYIERGEIRPVIAATFPLKDIVVAQEAFVAKRHVGKIVLTL